MSRKQNSLMRFSRTERLAQLSEQEVVIERKKREIQAKIEAQKKKETEEAYRKLEASHKEKNNDLNYSKKPSWKRDGTDRDREKVIDLEKQDSLKNAFSNDGSFLDHFKKMVQSNTSLNNAESGKKNNFCAIDDYRQNEDKERESLSSRKPLDSNIQLQLPPPGVVQLVPQHQMVSLIEPNVPIASTPSVQMSAVQPMVLGSVPQFTTNEIQLKAISSPPFSESSQSMHATPFSNTVTSSAASVEKEDENIKNSYLSDTQENPSGHELYSASSQNFPTSSSFSKSQNKQFPFIPQKKSEQISKGYSDSVSMTFKNNTTKKLEIIANPLAEDDEDDDAPDSEMSKKDAQFKFGEAKRKNTKDLLHNSEFQNSYSFSSQNEESSRISPAFFNEEHEYGGKDCKQSIQSSTQWADEFEKRLNKCNDNESGMRFGERTIKQKSEQNCREDESNYFDEPRMQSFVSNDINVEKKYNDKLDNFSLNTKLQQSSFSKYSDGYQGDNEEDCGSHKYSEKKLNQIGESSNPNSDETNAEQLKVEERRKRKRKSRWGDMATTNSQPAILTPNLNLQPGKLPAPKTNLLSQLTRSDPGLIKYAKQTFGSTNLSEEDWKKAEDHYKINLLYQDLIKKRAEIKKLEKAGKFKYEYDSDEDVEGGTWEHKLRQQEMMATQLWAEELTRQAAGKHHIGDFLPPEELERFMEKYNAVKEGREPDLSDYKEFKLKEDNVGYRLLQKMGWNEGQGLGQDGSGMTHPVNKAATRHENQGLGLERPDGLEAGDDEYDAYRKRMMLAYRFRPNPLMTEAMTEASSLSFSDHCSQEKDIIKKTEPISTFSSDYTLTKQKAVRSKAKYNTTSNEKKEILLKCYRDGKTIACSASIAGINKKTAYSIIENYKNNLVTPSIKTRGGRRHFKITDNILSQIEKIVEENPGISLKNISAKISQLEGFTLSLSSIHNALYKLKITLKRTSLDTEQLNSPETIRQRKLYATHFSSNAPTEREKIIFVDESGFNYHMRPPRARSKTNTEATVTIPTQIVNRGRNVSLLAAMNVHGLILKETVSDSCVNSSVFCNFLSELIEKLDESHIKNAWIILDSGAISKTSEVLDLINKTTHKMIFLSPYSPMLNPMEKVFEKVKFEAREILSDPQNCQDLTEVIDESTKMVTSNDCSSYFLDMTTKLPLAISEQRLN